MRNKPKIVCHRHGGPELRLVRVRVGRVMSIGNGPSTTERRHGSALQLGGGAAAGAFGHERNERDEYLCTKPKIAIRRPDTAEICSEADRPPLASYRLVGACGESTTERRHGPALQLGGGAAAGAFGRERDERGTHVCTTPKIAIRRPDTAEICSEADRPPLAELEPFARIASRALRRGDTDRLYVSAAAPPPAPLGARVSRVTSTYVQSPRSRPAD